MRYANMGAVVHWTAEESKQYIPPICANHGRAGYYVVTWAQHNGKRFASSTEGPFDSRGQAYAQLAARAEGRV